RALGPAGLRQTAQAMNMPSATPGEVAEELNQRGNLRDANGHINNDAVLRAMSHEITRGDQEAALRLQRLSDPDPAAAIRKMAALDAPSPAQLRFNSLSPGSALNPATVAAMQEALRPRSPE